MVGGLYATGMHRTIHSLFQKINWYSALNNNSILVEILYSAERKMREQFADSKTALLYCPAELGFPAMK